MENLGTAFAIVIGHVVVWGILIEWFMFRIRESRRNGDDR